jgi:hypothetical protein
MDIKTKEAIKKKFNDLEVSLKRAEDILDRRYFECEEKGHQKIVKRGSYCNHCYRHTKYETSRVNAFLRGRAQLNLSALEEPIDAPYVMEMIERELQEAKISDYFEGVAKVMKEKGF